MFVTTPGNHRRFLISPWRARLLDPRGCATRPWLNDRTQTTFPPVNVWVGEQSIVVSVPIPGVELNELDVTVQTQTLVLTGPVRPLRPQSTVTTQTVATPSVATPSMVQPSTAEQQTGEPSTTDSPTGASRQSEPERFRRSVALPFDVDPATAQATYDRGVLTVRLNRPTHQQPLKVAIQQG
jgi:HSP20 family protein